MVSNMLRLLRFLHNWNAPQTQFPTQNHEERVREVNL